MLARRPALVISPRRYNSKAGLALVCVVTSTLLDDPFEVALPDGLSLQGAIIADQVRTIDWSARHAVCVGTATTRTVGEVLRLVSALVSARA